MCVKKSLAAVLLALVLPVLPFYTVGAVGTSAAAAVLICADTGDVLYAHQAQKKLPMASTTKIMTGLLLAEQPDLTKTVTVTKEMVAVEGSSMGLLPGDTVSLNDLLYGLLLASGNDAANTVAITVAGSVPAFVRLMNERAAALGLQNTCFQTPSGLDGDNHYTTAEDLAALTAVALKNTYFAAACKAPTAQLCFGNPPYKRTLKNHNRLLQSYQGLIGVKTGYTKKAGRCLVTAATREGRTLIAVTLNDPNDWEDHENLLNYGFENCCTVTPEVPLPDFVPVIGAQYDAVAVTASPQKFTLSSQNAQKITAKVYMQRFLYVPVMRGQQVGEVHYFFGGKKIQTVPIQAVAEVQQQNLKISFWQKLYQALKLLWI